MSYLDDLADQIKEAFTQDIDIDNLIPSKDNFYGIRDIEELADSIKNTRLMHNLVVRKIDGGKYEILAGERRYRALVLLGTKKAPCLIVDLDDTDAKLFMIESNAQQRELTAAEKMKQIKMLEEIFATKKKLGYKIPSGKKTRDLIGEEIGMSGPQVGKYQAVTNNLIPGLIIKLEKDKISFKQAQELSRLFPAEQYLVYKKLIDGISKEDIDKIIKEYKQALQSNKNNRIQEAHKENIIAPVKVEDTNSDENTKNETKDIEKVTVERKEDNQDHDVVQIETDLKKLLTYDPIPKLVLYINGVETILYTSYIKIKQSGASNHKLAISLSGFGTISIPLSYLKKVESIPNGLKPKLGYNIHEGVYLWFKRKEEQV